MRRFLLPAAMAAGSFALGGVPGFLLGFAAACLAVDRALDLRETGATDAFRRASRRRSGSLPYLADDVGWAAVAPRRRLGVQPVAVASIVGTTDRHKAATFDGSFRPPAFSRDRWCQLWRSARRGEALPAIAVYRVGDEHFVRDGHHRVSVARALGLETIDADVVELQPSWRMVSVAHSTAA
jgi:hypothetical protein